MGHPPKAIIIGAGIGGLGSAIRLAVQGYAVTVFEQNGSAGGKLTYFEENGYHFDGGPSLFTQPQLVAELFALAGEPMEDYFEYKPVPIACKYFFEDGTIINGYTDKNALAAELHATTGEDESAVKDYLFASQKLYNTTGSIFLNHSLHKLSTLWKAPVVKALFNTHPKYLFSTFNGINTKGFKHPHTVQLFNRYATYNGSNPYKAPGMLSLIPHLEYNEGIY